MPDCHFCAGTGETQTGTAVVNGEWEIYSEACPYCDGLGFERDKTVRETEEDDANGRS